MIRYLTAAAIVAAVLGGGVSSASAGRWVFCSNDGGFCHAGLGAMIHYGRRGAFTHRLSPPGGLPCNNEVFGDPLVGVPRSASSPGTNPLESKGSVESAIVAANFKALVIDCIDRRSVSLRVA